MYGLDNQSGVNVMPALAPLKSPTPLWFTEGGSGLAPSYPGQDWFNMIQAEILGVLSKGSIKPEKNKLNQLAEAISAIIASYSYSKTEINLKFQPAGSYASKDEVNQKFDKTGGGLKGDFGVLYLNSITENQPLYMSFFNAASKLLGFIGRPDSKEDIALVNSLSGAILRLTSGNKLTFNDFDVMTSNDVTQSVGTSTTSVMSQKAVKEALENKINTTAIVQSTGQNQYSVMSQKSVTNSMIGVEQVWKDVLSERKSGTTYTNTTGKPIVVAVSGYINAGSQYGVLLVDNVSAGSIGTGTSTTTAIVPAGSTYKLTNSILNMSWAELR